MINFYLSNSSNLNKVLTLLEISLDEIESIVGRFPNDHHRWPGELKGQLKLVKKELRIVHHFTKKKLWFQNISEKDLLTFNL